MRLMKCRWEAVEKQESCGRPPADGFTLCSQHLVQVTERAMAASNVPPKHRPYVQAVATAFFSGTATAITAAVYSHWDEIWAAVELVIQAIRMDGRPMAVKDIYVLRWPDGSSVRMVDTPNGPHLMDNPLTAVAAARS